MATVFPWVPILQREELKEVDMHTAKIMPKRRD